MIPTIYAYADVGGVGRKTPGVATAIFWFILEVTIPNTSENCEKATDRHFLSEIFLKKLTLFMSGNIGLSRMGIHSVL